MNAANIQEKPCCGGPIIGTSGTVVRQREVPGFTLIETTYPAGLSLGRHGHAHAYLSFVLTGGYKEKYANRECACPAGSWRFLPPEELHENHFAAAARILLVKIGPSALGRFSAHSPALSRPGEVSGLASPWLANRLYREFLASDDVAPLAMEGVLLEILAESAREIGKGGSHAPLWLQRVREALEDSYPLAPSLTELSAIAEVHPVHLSREFRKHYDTTIGAFIRKRRVQHACELLANSDTSLSEIALVCGFSDQSHFCSMFKSHTGLTPAKFRDVSARPSAARMQSEAPPAHG